jgi:MFS transporter, DHA3 family, macrolide efflux protein
VAFIKGPTGLRGFTVIWIGQVVSQLGSAMTWFAFSIWAWKITGEATTLALVLFFSYIPTLLFSPIAGALVDRWNKRLVMALSDLGTALATLVILLLYITHFLQVWHLYVAALFAGVFLAFQFPAYSAATTLMLPKDQYARAEGMLGLSQAIPGILAPLLAAALLAKIDFAGVMVVDLLTFLAAFGTLLWVHIPQPAKIQLVQQGNLWKESLFGFRYIFERPGLRALVLLFLGGNFFEGLCTTLIAPMVLARAANDAVVLGSVESIGALGGILGGVLISLWGGPKRRILGIVIGWTCAFGLGLLMMGAGGVWIVWAIAYSCFAFFAVIVNSSEQALWQTKVAPGVLGRVSATRLLLIQVPYLVAMPLAGWLADSIFEPAMMSNGPLSVFTWLVGVGPGAGMALIFILAGLGGMLVVLSGYAFRSVRHVEDLLPDYDGQSPVSVEAGV